MMKQQGHIFVSYPRVEIEFVAPFVAELKNLGIRVWMDVLDGIRGGHNWPEQIAEAINESLAMLVVLCPEYIASKYCMRELYYADNIDLPLIPVRLREIHARKYPLLLSGIQYFDFVQVDWHDKRVLQSKTRHFYESVLAEATYNSQLSEASIRALVGPVPSTEEQYLNDLIAQLEARAGVLEYVELSAQLAAEESAFARPDPNEYENQTEYAMLVTVAGTEEGQPLEQEKVPVSNIIEAYKEHRRFVLIGEPGAGKTTTLRRLARDAADARKQGATTPIPLLLYLPAWSETETIEAFIQRHWTLAGDPLSLIHEGHIQLFLDGLNEMGLKGAEKAQQLRQWIESPSGPQYLVATCRQADYSVKLNLALPTILVEEMNDSQIEKFAQNYLGQERSSKFLKLVTNPDKSQADQRHLARLTRNPYLLAALIYVYNESDNTELPRNTGTLFRELAKRLWEREIERGAVSNISFEIMEERFSRLAFTMISEDTAVDVSHDYAQQHLGDSQLLIAGRNANLIEIRPNGVRFFHQLMQEYFAAFGLLRVGLSEILKRPRLDYLVGRIAYKWDQVVIALCGIAENPSSIVQEIATKDPFLAAECLGSGVIVEPQVESAVIQQLVSRISSYDLMAQRAAVRAIPLIGLKAIPGLLSVVVDPKESVRDSVIKALGQIGDEKALPALLTALQDQDPLVKRSAARAVGQVGSSQGVLPLLQALRQTNDRRFQNTIATSLGLIGKDSLSSILEAFDLEDTDGKVAILRAIKYIADERALPLLKATAIAHEHIDIQRAAVEALTAIKSPHASDVLVDMLTSPTIQPKGQHELILMSVCNVLRERGWKPSTPLEAVRFYGVLGEWDNLPAWGNEIVPFLSEFFGADFDLGKRAGALMTVSKLENPSLPPSFEDVLMDKDERLALGAIEVLGRVQLSDSVHLLYKAAKYHLSLKVRHIADQQLYQRPSQLIQFLVDSKNDEAISDPERADLISNMKVKLTPEIAERLIGLFDSQREATARAIIQKLSPLRSPEVEQTLLQWWRDPSGSTAIRSFLADVISPSANEQIKQEIEGWRKSQDKEAKRKQTGLMQTVKIVITGPFSAGKTAFISTLSEIDVVSTEKKVSSEAESLYSPNTTVAMDFGRLTVSEDLVIYFFGTPGQRRFDFMWEILAEGMLGFIVLVDSTRPETFREAKAILETFRGYAPTPYIIAANKQDSPDAWAPEDLRIALRIEDYVKIVPCVAKDLSSVKTVFLELIYSILEEMDA